MLRVYLKNYWNFTVRWCDTTAVSVFVLNFVSHVLPLMPLILPVYVVFSLVWKKTVAATVQTGDWCSAFSSLGLLVFVFPVTSSEMLNQIADIIICSSSSIIIIHRSSRIVTLVIEYFWVQALACGTVFPMNSHLHNLNLIYSNILVLWISILPSFRRNSFNVLLRFCQQKVIFAVHSTMHCIACVTGFLTSTRGSAGQVQQTREGEGDKNPVFLWTS